MDSRRDDIIAELKNNEAEIINFFKSLNTDQLAMTVYPEDPHWTVQQVLAHFITIEGSMQWLFKDILAGGPGSPEDFDVDRFNRTGDSRYLASLVKAQRKSMALTAVGDLSGRRVVVARAMADQDLDREGRHAFHGHGKLGRFIVWVYEHTRLHLDDIRKVID